MVQHKKFFNRCGVGALLLVSTLAINSANTKASNTAKMSGIAGISVFMDAAYVQGGNRVVNADVETVGNIEVVNSTEEVASNGAVVLSSSTTDESIQIVSEYDVEEDGTTTNKTASELESTVEEVKSKYENIGISIADPYVNIRSKPNAESKILGKLYKGSKCDIIKTVGDWVKIESGNAKGYIKSEFLARGFAAEELIDEYGTKFAIVNTETLNVRFENTTESRIATQVPMDEKLQILKQDGDWYEVSINNGAVTGWVSAEFVKVKISWKHAITIEEEERELARAAAAEAALAARQNIVNNAQARQTSSTNTQSKTVQNNYVPVSGSGSEIANFALNFVGNPYVWGGTSLTRGADCSGFVMSVYANFGVYLNRTSRAQASNGRAVSLNELQPGDLVFYAPNGGVISHVAMYIGGGKVVHASTPSTGIKVSSVYHQTPYCARRIVE